MFAVIRLILVLAIIGAIGGGLWYVTGLRADLAMSAENNRKMEEAVLQQQIALEQIQADQERIKKANDELTSTIKAQNQDMNALKNRFNTNADGSARDIGKIALEKPASIERAVNRGTKNALRCIEIASGAPLTQEEESANSTGEINKECPSIANPNYKPQPKPQAKTDEKTDSPSTTK